VADDVKKEDVITEENVHSIRLGFGLHPKYLPEDLGKKFVKDCEKGERFSIEMVE
jgi:pseudaminic acid synthase